MRRQDGEEQALLPGQKIVEGENAFALGGARFAHAQEPAETAIGRAVRRVSEDVRRAVDEDETAAHEQTRRDAALFDDLVDRLISPHDAGQRVAVRDADGRHAVERRRPHIFMRMRGAAQEREVRGDGELCISGHHANTQFPAIRDFIRDFKKPARSECARKPCATALNLLSVPKPMDKNRE